MLAAAGLLVTGMTAAHADTAPTAATATTAGSETDTPSLVTGLSEEAAGTGSAADAARGHLKAKKSRYHIADTSAKDLSAVSTDSRGGKETVRLQQKYKGVDVLGGQYVVRMTKKDGKRTVTGTSGNYFTELKLDSVSPKVSEKTAIERAIGAVTSQLGGAPLHAPAKGEKLDSTPLTGKAVDVTILPQGTGVLTRHITVTGTNPADGTAVKQEVYVDGHSGFPVMQYSGIQTLGATGAAASGSANEADDAGRRLHDGRPALPRQGIRYPLQRPEGRPQPVQGFRRHLPDVRLRVSAVAGIGQTAITDDGVFWVEDGDGTDTGQAAVMRANADGTDRTTILPESGSQARCTRTS